jgi:3-hydroxyisobutyrate dehydrogenase-like beta-hydroxyacid dehydrogenase
MGKEIVRCGEVGYGTRMKLVINMLLGSMMASFAEALAFGRRMGLEFEAILQTITAGALGSPLFKIKGQAISEGNYTKNFPVDLIFKDLNLVLHEAGKIGTPLPLASATREAYSGTVGLGLGSEDMAALVKYYEKIADIKIADGGE